MAVKSYRPTSPALRQMTVADFSELTDKKPESRLLRVRKQKSGRNSYGRITVRHRGGGNRRKIRILDWKRTKDNVPAKVAALEYDPNRSARIALLHYADGAKSYILAPDGLKIGGTIISGESVDPVPGNCMPLRNMPVGVTLHAIEMKPGRGAQLVRAAGAAAQLMAKENGFAQLRMPSGEYRLIPDGCRATVGTVGNLEHENITLGKAGRVRHMGRRPMVRGKVMNPVDHPHGGGEGRNPIGLPSPMSPWGKPTLGKKTRNKHKQSNKYILRRRKK
ncbi:MAG: 50S ribosomal protein L2 [Clostridiales bacterium]|nr:50S ribosomal protein L2 [Clostridiales bacterium]MDD7432828.1 50S ribosomal protein L2 [Clostridiales bacterium]MDY3061496.1 50S ribosomal protein L2 [Eubacteriales bacterium]